MAEEVESGAPVHLSHDGHGTPFSRVRAVITTMSPPFARCSTINADSPEDTVATREIRTSTRP
ncbi:hypothetical protein [Streptomyces sp. GC420]|uniref:hypothetical protein n=1 Tax=Streptomyces sp. GC420 TaxID=2697568 RepID=UPI0014152F9C|nr:hypothetical protein [Streptomyces sp. GC420]NBM16010.1 hypothetical protein [Streptomyces sp. GC420]